MHEVFFLLSSALYLVQSTYEPLILFDYTVIKEERECKYMQLRFWINVAGVERVGILIAQLKQHYYVICTFVARIYIGKKGEWRLAPIITH